MGEGRCVQSGHSPCSPCLRATNLRRMHVLRWQAAKHLSSTESSKMISQQTAICARSAAGGPGTRATSTPSGAPGTPPTVRSRRSAHAQSDILSLRRQPLRKLCLRCPNLAPFRSRVWNFTETMAPCRRVHLSAICTSSCSITAEDVGSHPQYKVCGP